MVAHLDEVADAFLAEHPLDRLPWYKLSAFAGDARGQDHFTSDGRDDSSRRDNQRARRASLKQIE